MNFELGYGKHTQSLEIAATQTFELLEANSSVVQTSEQELICRALAAPIQSAPLSDLVKPSDKVAIITSDITRPMPSNKVLPVLLDSLYDCGVAPKNISLVFALGSHRKHTEQEMRQLVGERAWREIRCVDGDPYDVVHIGTTSQGTPVDIFSEVAQSDVRICLGNIEYHYFAGYSGGAKAIMPGVSTFKAIQANHRLMVDPRACTANLKNNPVREDLEEAAAMLGVDFILNVVLDENKRIVHAVAGDMIAAHRRGCALLDEMYRCTYKNKADIVVASQGGAPKDMNLYQTQKALDNASRVVRDGGIIVLVGACPEGFGNERFQRWLTEASEPHDILVRVSKNFELGGHKAAAMAQVMERASIFLVSQLAEDEVRAAFMVPFKSVQEAFNKALKQKGKDAQVAIIPHAGSVLPEQEA